MSHVKVLSHQVWWMCLPQSSALFQIADNGVPLSKLIIGKPATRADANSGFMLASTLAGCVKEARSRGWSKSLNSSYRPLFDW